MTINFAVLKNELTLGSFAATYSTAITRGDYNALVDTVNSVTTSTITIGIARATTLQECVVIGEYSNLAQPARDLWGAIVTTATTGISISNTIIRAQIAGIWSAGTTTRTNLVNAQTRPCSRAESLFGENVVLDTNLIYIALTQG